MVHNFKELVEIYALLTSHTVLVIFKITVGLAYDEKTVARFEAINKMISME